jgi:hypothetical protein
VVKEKRMAKQIKISRSRDFRLSWGYDDEFDPHHELEFAERGGDPDEISLWRETVEKIDDGEWSAFFVRAAVNIPIPYGSDTITLPLASPGLWGIVADSNIDLDEPFIQEVYEQEADTLEDMVKALAGLKVVK